MTKSSQRRAFERTYHSILDGAGTVRPATKKFAIEHAKGKAGCDTHQADEWSRTMPADELKSPFGRQDR